MRCLIGIVGMLAAALGWAVCAAEDERPIVLDGVAAYANEHVITIGDVLQLMDPVRRQLAARFQGEELKNRLEQAFVDARGALIERYLVLDAYEAGDAKLPAWVVDKRVDDFIRETFDGDRSALMEALAAESLSYGDWRKRMEEQIIVASMRGASVEQQVNVLPEEAKAYYEANPAEFMNPARVDLRMIVLNKAGAAADARQRAQAVRSRIEAGEDFALVAREISQGAKTAEGGDWGWIEPGLLRPELAAAIAGLEPGILSEVIETPDEFYILTIMGRQKASRIPFKDAEASIQRLLERREADALHAAWIDRLSKDAYIRLLPLDVF